MAAGFPTKVTYANGDVFNASDINDTNGTLNYISPVSATNNQVLTRDSASPGQVKWANSPANTLTTTGDLYYASAANTPARLAIGTAGQVLGISGGIPAWQAAGGGMTVITSGTFASTSLSLTSITGIYKDLRLVYLNPNAAAATTLMTINGLASGYEHTFIPTNSTTLVSTTAAANFSAIMNSNGVTDYFEITFPQYSNATRTVQRYYGLGKNSTNNGSFVGRVVNVTGAITSITDTRTYTSGTYILYGIS